MDLKRIYGINFFKIQTIFVFDVCVCERRVNLFNYPAIRKSQNAVTGDALFLLSRLEILPEKFRRRNFTIPPQKQKSFIDLKM